MSNEIIQELEMDLSREKEKIFFQKYKYIIIAITSTILLGVVGYQYFKFQEENKFQSAADDYYNFKQFYTNIEELTNINSKPPKLLPETVTDVSSYLAMSQLVRFNNARKHDASASELLKIINDYLKNPQPKPLTIHDSLLKLFNLSLLSDKIDFASIEPQFIDYLNHPFAFKSIAYEMLFLLSLDTQDAHKAKIYLKNLEETTSPQAINKIKIYQTHPLVQNLKTSLQEPVKNKTLTQ